MQLSDVIALIGAGYSKADIEAMEAQDQIEAPMPQPQPEQAPPIPDPTPQPAQDNTELLEAIKTLTAALQHNNKINTPQPETVTEATVQTQADDILAKFCNT